MPLSLIRLSLPHFHSHSTSRLSNLASSPLAPIILFLAARSPQHTRTTLGSSPLVPSPYPNFSKLPALTELSESGHRLHELRRGLVGEIIGAGDYLSLSFSLTSPLLLPLASS